jgi:hypothetical protein
VKYAFAIFAALVVIVAGLFLWQHFKPEPKPVLPPAPPSAGEVPVQPAENVTHGDPSLPKPDEHTTGVLRITVAPDSVAKPRDIFVYIDRDPKRPPQIRSEAPVQAQYAPVVDPWLKLEARLMVGGSGSFDGYVSPWAGVSLLQLFQKVSLGAGVDRTAVGAFVSYEFFREFNVGAMYYILPIRDGTARAGIFVAYRF